MTALTYEKENEMFFLFLRCAARDLGLFRNCSRNVPGTKRTTGNSSGTSVLIPTYPLRRNGSAGLEQKKHRRSPRLAAAALSTHHGSLMTIGAWLRSGRGGGVLIHMRIVSALAAAALLVVLMVSGHG
jgi:hypothetical protein